MTDFFWNFVLSHVISVLLLPVRADTIRRNVFHLSLVLSANTQRECHTAVGLSEGKINHIFSNWAILIQSRHRHSWSDNLSVMVMILSRQSSICIQSCFRKWNLQTWAADQSETSQVGIFQSCFLGRNDVYAWSLRSWACKKAECFMSFGDWSGTMPVSRFRDILSKNECNRMIN